MCRLALHDYGENRVTREVFHLMSLGLSGGVVFPELRELDWKANHDTLPFYRLFLSPKLSILSLWFSTSPESLERDLSMVESAVMGLDPFPLQFLYLRWLGPEAGRQMESVASSVVLRCGTALEDLSTFSPLSDAAVQHIMQLPNLNSLSTASTPPRTSDLPLSAIFPRLNRISLVEEDSLGWLTFFTTTTRRISSGQGSHPPLKYGPVEKLRELTIVPKAIIDAAFMSRIIHFRELTFLKLKSACYTGNGCAFNLTDDDIAEIAAALPRLEMTVLGRACDANSCQTTVASLVSLSTHCKNLRFLNIHFNTANLRNDLDSLLGDPQFGSLPTLRTSDNFHLDLSSTPYPFSEDDIIPVLRGFRRIFPSLTRISGIKAFWKQLELRLLEV